ncbi:MAG: hypothetical protein WAR37_01435 [Candidatus Microsaccharimonas sp.]
MQKLILNRWLIDAIRSICEARNIAFTSYSDDWLLELTYKATTKRILGYKFPLNLGIASQIAEDKVATYTLLNAYNVPAVPHVLLRPGMPIKGVDWSKVVLKPLAGTGGQDIHKFDTPKAANDWVQQQPVNSWALSPYLKIKKEVRFVILNGEILLTYEKIPVNINGLLMFNLGFGAVPKKITASTAMQNLALEAQQVIGLSLTAIDIVELDSGVIKVLECNDGIMLEHFSRTSDEYRKDAYKIYEDIVSTIFPEAV